MYINKKCFIKIALIVLIVLFIAILGYFVLIKIQQTPNSRQAQQDLNKIFHLNEKEAGTKIYYSKKLGVGFTYFPNNPDGHKMKVAEAGNKIYLYDSKVIPEQGKIMEILTKDPKVNFKEAIKSKFIKSSKDLMDCMIVIYGPSLAYDESTQSISRDTSARIVGASPGELGSDKCPRDWFEKYNKDANGYFFMNENIPGKFLFVSSDPLGVLYPTASDGTPNSNNSADNFIEWIYSIKILN